MSKATPKTSHNDGLSSASCAVIRNVTLSQEKHPFEPVWYVTAHIRKRAISYSIKIGRETSGQVRSYRIYDALGSRIGEAQELAQARRQISDHAISANGAAEQRRRGIDE